MKSYILYLLFLIAFFAPISMTFSQVAAVKFTVQVPENTPADKNVYLAGSFNYWHEHDSLYQMHKGDKGLYSITIPVFENQHYEYKYTLGSWQKVEVAFNDSSIANRQFLSTKNKKISDTVRKWKQPNLKTDSSEQLKKITAMKDSVVAKLKPELDSIQGLLKLYVQNLLLQNPDATAHQNYDEKAVQHLGYMFKALTHLFWNIFANLSQEQKQQISKAINQPGQTDFLNSFLGAFNNTVK